jgi:hypothetical protein
MKTRSMIVIGGLLLFFIKASRLRQFLSINSSQFKPLPVLIFNYLFVLSVQSHVT